MKAGCLGRRALPRAISISIQSTPSQLRRAEQKAAHEQNGTEGAGERGHAPGGNGHMGKACARGAEKMSLGLRDRIEKGH